MTLLELAVKELLKLGVRQAVPRLQRQAGVLRLLKTLHIDPKKPPRDFESIYVFALVQHCWGAPPFVVRFFENSNLRAAFKLSFEADDDAAWEAEADQLMLVESENKASDWIDYDPRRELASFRATFHEVLSSTRVPSEVRAEGRLIQLQETLSAESAATRSAVGSAADLLEQIRNDLAALISDRVEEVIATSQLRADLLGWLQAVGYTFESYEDSGEDHFSYLINVPTRRGRPDDRVLVRAYEREVVTIDVEDLEHLVTERRLDEGWLVGRRRVSSAARAASETGVISCYTFDELIDLDANFEPYLNWLEAEVERLGLVKRYVDLAGLKDEADRTGQRTVRSRYDRSNGWIDGYVDTWLDDSTKEHLSILGEFGTGKTWFCLHYAWQLAQEYREAVRRGRARPRLPILIPLRDYAKAVSVESLFSEFFFRKHQLNLPGYSAFEQLNRMGRLLLIFDGFDEMAARIDRQAMINNFWELAKAVVPGAKVLLTCRTEHFPAAQEGKALLSAQLMASTASLSGEPPQFEVIELQPWDDGQVVEVLKGLTDEATVEEISRSAELMDLLRRPVMSELVIDAIPEVESGQPISLTRIYLYAIRRKLARDIKSERTFTGMREKLFFLCELSWEMMTQDRLALNYRLMPERIRRYFGGSVLNEKDLDHWHYDMMGQTLLIRNNQGDYFPAHRSFLEFFVALKAVAELGLLSGTFLDMFNDDSTADAEVASPSWETLFASREGSRHVRSRIASFTAGGEQRLVEVFGSVRFTLATLDMIGEILSVDEAASLERLMTYVKSTSDERLDTKLFGGTCANLILLMNRDGLAGADLAGANISLAMLDRGPSNQSNLAGTDLSSANCRGVDFENVILKDSRFRDADLTGCRYLGFQPYFPIIVATDPTRRSAVIAISVADSTLVDRVDLVTAGSERIAEIPQDVYEAEVSADGRWLIGAGDSGNLILDLADGRAVFADEAATGTVFVADTSGQPVEVWLRADDRMRIFKRWSLQYERIVGTVEMPEAIHAGFWDASIATSFLLDTTGALWEVRVRGAEAHYARFGRVDSIVGRSGLGYAGGIIWVESLVREGRQSFQGYNLAGERVYAFDYLLDDVTERQLPLETFESWGIPQVVATRGNVMKVDLDGLRIFRPGVSDTGELLLDRAVTALCLGSQSDTIVYADRFGNVGLADPENGAFEPVVNLSTALRGADFTGVKGLSDEHLALLRTMGATG